MTLPLRDAFVQGMSRAATTVNIVASDGPAGRVGVTVSAMASVSADGEAPTLLVCVHHLSPAAEIIRANGCFAVSVLRDDQSFISDTFAGRLKTATGDKFACCNWALMPTGAPRVAEPLVAFDCRVKSAERIGTHLVFIGEVQETCLPASGTPLIYANRAYGAPARLISLPRSFGPAAGQGAYRIGCLATFGPWLLPAILRSLEDALGPVRLDLHEGDQRHLLELLREGSIDLAFLYDFDLGDDITRLTIADLAPYVLLPEGDPLSALPEVALGDLAARRMVLLDAPPSRDYFLSLFDGTSPPSISYRAKSFEMVRGMVAHGLGYAILATKPAGAISYDGKPLITRPLAGNLPKSRLVLCGRKGPRQSPEAESFALHTAHAFGLDLE